MTILVTGAAGFVGSHLCDQLLLLGHKVIGLDNLVTGSEENLTEAYKNPNFSFLKHDITEPLTIAEPIDQIYNLACPASPVHYQTDPIQTLKTSVVGMLTVLNLAREKKARVLQASTSEVYGDPMVHPQTEEYRGNVNPIGPRACYDEGKRCAETLCFDYHRTLGLEIKVARIFNTYGPRMAFADGRVVSNFITQALRGESITLHGDGSQTRSFCFITDLVTGLIAFMNTAGGITGPLNLGNPDEFTVRELAEQVIQTVGSSSSIISISDFRIDDPMQRRPDITKAQEFLQWKPRVSLSEGLIQTAHDFKQRLII